MIVKNLNLRPHHALCIRNFCGKGYDSEFTKNMAKITDFLAAFPDTMITLISGADSICIACPNNICECCRDEKVTCYDNKMLSFCSLEIGNVLSWKTLCEIVDEKILTPKKLNKICIECCWSDICLKDY